MKLKSCIFICCLVTAFTVNADTAEYRIPFLDSEASIRIDRWGVPHINAGSEQEAYFVQGFNIARTRLWQVDLWRRRGLGLLSEVFGPAFIEKDRASRLFLYRGSMKKEWRKYGKYTQSAAGAFVAGINQYIDLIENGDVALPIEFSLLDYKPAKWKPEDLARIRVHGLSRNVNSEVTRALVTRDFGLDLDNLRVKLSPAHQTSIPDGADYSGLPNDVLKIYQLATASVSFYSFTMLAQNTKDNSQADFKAALVDELLNPVISDAQRSSGSNNWAISPSRTTTNRAILASDPHRINSLPSGRYIVHLQAPGLNVIGAGEPFIPGVSIGHNDHIAFGFTIFSADQEDLYQYQTKAADNNWYRYRGHWRKVKKVQEVIPVKDADDVTVTLKYTKHGPVIYEDSDTDTMYGVRAAWLKPGMAPYLASLRYQKSNSWRQYKKALRRFGNPSENHVYADIHGNIGWQAAGKIPFRYDWDGLLPVPGDGRYEWLGYIPMRLLPSEYNPSRGWVATANEMNLPENYPFSIGYEWADPYRYQRISEVLSSSENHSIESTLQLQTDYLSIPARELMAVLNPDDFSSQLVIGRLVALKAWDKKLTPESIDAAFFEIWWSRFLRPVVALELAPEQALPYLAGLSSFADQQLILSLIKSSMLDQGIIAKARMVELITQTIAAAEYHLFENQLAQRPWGELHSAKFSHPLSRVLPPDLAELLNVGPPMRRGGSIDTVNSNWYATNLTGNFETVAGTSWRMVIDVGNWDASMVVSTPGQSGDPRSPFYRNLFPVWANDGSFPLLYSEEGIAANTVKTIILLPE